MKKTMFVLLVLFFIIGILSACKQQKTNSKEAFSSNLQSSGIVSQENKAEISYLHDFTIEDSNGNALITNSDVEFVEYNYEERNGHYIQLYFTSAGKDKFAQVTRDNMGNQIYIRIDGETVSQPTINAEITDGIAVIVGLDEQEVLDIYDKLT